MTVMISLARALDTLERLSFLNGSLTASVSTLSLHHLFHFLFMDSKQKTQLFSTSQPGIIKTIKSILYITPISIHCATSSYSDDVDRNVQHRCSASTSCVRLYINYLKLQLLMKVRVMITTIMMMKRLYLKAFLIE